MNRQLYFSQIITNFKSLKQSLMGQHDFKKDGIPYGQKDALFVIALHDRLNVKQLANFLHITSGAATQHVEALLQEDLVKRQQDPADRRNVIISLSSNGQRLFSKMQKARLAKFEKLFASVTDEELMIYSRVMEKVIQSTQIQKGSDNE